MPTSPYRLILSPNLLLTFYLDLIHPLSSSSLYLNGIRLITRAGCETAPILLMLPRLVTCDICDLSSWSSDSSSVRDEDIAEVEVGHYINLHTTNYLYY